MQSPPPPSNLVNAGTLFDICLELQHEVKELDPGRPIEERCYEIGRAINDALNKPVFNADGKINLPAVKALADAESRYLRLVVSECHPRCFTFEQVFQEIRAAIPAMPDPQVPTISHAPAMTHMAEYYDEKVIYIQSRIEMCKEHIKKGPSLPKMPMDMEQLMKDTTVKACGELLCAAYDRVGVKDLGLKALHLLAPHLSNPLFRACIFSIYVTEIYLSGYKLFAPLNIFLEAHGLRPPAHISPTLTIGELNPKAGTRLCDLLPSKYTYLPLHNAQVYHPGGMKLDYNVHMTSRYFQHIIKTMTDHISQDNDYCKMAYQKGHNLQLLMIQSLKTFKDYKNVEELLAILGKHSMLTEDHELAFQIHLVELVGWMATFYYDKGSH